MFYVCAFENKGEDKRILCFLLLVNLLHSYTWLCLLLIMLTNFLFDRIQLVLIGSHFSIIKMVRFYNPLLSVFCSSVHL